MSSPQNTFLVFSLSILCACAPPAAEGSGTLDLTLTGEIDADADLYLDYEVSQDDAVVATGSFETLTATVEVPAGELEVLVGGAWVLDPESDTASEGHIECEGGASVEIADGEAMGVEISLDCDAGYSD